MSIDGETTRREFDPSEPLNSFVRVVSQLLIHPVVFFREIPRRGSYVPPLLFALICGEISTILGGLLELIGIGQGAQGGVFRPSFVIPGLEIFFRLSGGLPESLRASILEFIVILIVAPIISAISLFIGAGILQLVIRGITGAENSGFRATFRIMSYAAVVSLVRWIPILGSLLALLALVYQIVGVREMHDTTRAKAIGVIILNIVVSVLIVVLGIFVIRSLAVA